jgi:hypothetical protein
MILFSKGEYVCLFGTFSVNSLYLTRVRRFKKSLTQPASHLMVLRTQKMGSTTVGSDGSIFTEMGSFSTDGSTRIGNTATGLGAVFNDRSEDKFGFKSRDDDKW